MEFPDQSMMLCDKMKGPAALTLWFVTSCRIHVWFSLDGVGRSS